MADGPKLVSLDQFRRKKPGAPPGHEEWAPPPPEASAAAPAADLRAPRLHPRTERRVAAALAAIEELKREEMEAIAAAPALKQHRVQFSAAAVARAAKIGRTQLYNGHPGIREAVEAARAEVEAALEERRRSRRPSSKRALEERIAELKARHEAEIKRLASQQLSALIERMGPVVESAQRNANETAALKARIVELEQQLAGQSSVLTTLANALDEARRKVR